MESNGRDVYGTESAPPQTQTRSNGRFVKPTLEEIKAYCDERRNGINPQKFFDSNEAKGWVVGTTKSPMKDWKAVIRTWESNFKPLLEKKEMTEEEYKETANPPKFGSIQ